MKSNPFFSPSAYFMMLACDPCISVTPEIELYSCLDATHELQKY